MDINVLCNTAAQLKTVLEYPEVNRIYLEADMLEEDGEYIRKQMDQGRKFTLALPYIMRESEPDPKGFDEVLVRSVDELSAYRGCSLASDYGVYAMNGQAVQVLRDAGVKRITAPLELNRYELGQLGMKDKELIVYGYIPTMVSAGCIRKNISGCDHVRTVNTITDRMGKKLSVENRCAYCYNLIYNTVPLSLFGILDKVMKLEPESIRINFTVEDSSQVRTVLDALKTETDPETDLTRGHFLRGVE